MAHELIHLKDTATFLIHILNSLHNTLKFKDILVRGSYLSEYLLKLNEKAKVIY